jgi:hypothetical protein
LFIVSRIKKQEVILFSTKNILKLSIVGAIALSASAASAGTLVVRSTGPSAKSYPAGKAVPDTATITLKPGDVVTVLAAGSTRVFKGPGSFKPTAQATAATGSSLGKLMSNAGASHQRTGATRSANSAPAKAPSSPNLWYVDVSRGGTICLADVTKASLWRPRSTDAQLLTLTSLADGKSVPVDFRAGMAVRTWPMAMPITNGGQYKFEGAGLKTPVTLKVAFVANSDNAPENTVGALISNGCSSQVDLIVDVATAEAAGGSPAN